MGDEGSRRNSSRFWEEVNIYKLLCTMVDKKTTTIQTYSSIAQHLEKGYDDYFTQVVRPHAEKFLSYTPDNGKILDAGCGTGTHSLYFHNKGYCVTSIDLSATMVDICQKKGLDAQVMYIEALSFEDNSFDAIRCHTCLIHLETKDLISKTLQ